MEVVNKSYNKDIQSSDIAYINPESWQKGEGVKWTGNINLDLESKRGNSDSDEFYGDLQTRLRRKNDRLSLEAEFEEDKSNGRKTEENWLSVGQYDYFLYEKLFYGVFMLAEHDRFQDLDLKYGIGPHIGYQFLESRESNFSANIALLYVNEDYYVSKDTDYGAIGWRIYFDRYLVSDKLQFYHRHNGLQDLSNGNNLSINSWTGLKIPLYMGFVISAEANIEYNKDAPDGVDKTDETYRVKLGYEW